MEEYKRSEILKHLALNYSVWWCILSWNYTPAISCNSTWIVKKNDVLLFNKLQWYKENKTFWNIHTKRWWCSLPFYETFQLHSKRTCVVCSSRRNLINWLGKMAPYYRADHWILQYCTFFCHCLYMETACLHAWVFAPINNETILPNPLFRRGVHSFNLVGHVEDVFK